MSGDFQWLYGSYKFAKIFMENINVWMRCDAMSWVAYLTVFVFLVRCVLVLWGRGGGKRGGAV